MGCWEGAGGSTGIGSLSLFSPSSYGPGCKEHARSCIFYGEQVPLYCVVHKLTPGPSTKSQMAWRSQCFALVEIPPVGSSSVCDKPLAFPLLSPHLTISFLHPPQPHPWLLWSQNGSCGRDLRDGSVAQKDSWLPEVTYSSTAKLRKVASISLPVCGS